MARRIIAVAPLLTLIVSLPGEFMLRCRMDGTLRPACCCPDEDAAATTGPVARQANCCDPELTASDHPPAERAGTADPVSPRWTTVVAATAGQAPSIRPVAAALERPEPARDGPPIVLLKHAFLI